MYLRYGENEPVEMLPGVCYKIHYKGEFITVFSNIGKDVLYIPAEKDKEVTPVESEDMRNV